ncbi:alpha-L-fucosidase 1 [Mercurialis annua]|uniref:alpha-L-fucosidase 1 n=1 Tax=Mercurialis annua TaxID=3986 RepID=UPI00216014D8|nr:alpha-L-fucosidase 1 [Mercurialis annua]
MIQNSIFNPRNPKPISNHTILVKVIIFLSLSSIPISHSSLKKPPPLPILPIPSARQLQWQLSSMALFLHFGTNTFTDSEWGSGQADPSVFNPIHFDPKQWVQVAKESGFNRVVLTAKHHDGFCLWQSDYTDYSVKSSSWRNGSGDVVKELALAAQEIGVDLGLYLSPWDRHESCYGKTLEYNEFYLGQMTELLTRHGEVKEVFLDGAKGEAEKDMDYFFDSWFSLIHQLQPGAVIFTDAGPDIRWIGDEAGVAGSTCWSLFNRSAVEIGGSTHQKYKQEGDPSGHDWVPAECDVSIRPGWFWHASETPKSAKQLLDIYYKSVGRNCPLLLNVPPNSSGLISTEDIKVLQEFAQLRSSIFSYNIGKIARLSASSSRGGAEDSDFAPYNVLQEGIDTYWAPEDDQSKWELYFEFEEFASFNLLQVEEPIHMGQRISEFHLEILKDGAWTEVTNGTTVGFKRILQFPTVVSRHIKFVVDKSRADPLISYLGIFMDEFSIAGHDFDNSLQMHPNSREVVQQQSSKLSISFAGKYFGELKKMILKLLEYNV